MYQNVVLIHYTMQIDQVFVRNGSLITQKSVIKLARFDQILDRFDAKEHQNDKNLIDLHCFDTKEYQNVSKRCFDTLHNADRSGFCSKREFDHVKERDQTGAFRSCF